MLFENNERKSKKFSYIILPNGQKKRTGFSFSQKGGAKTTAEIDAAFDSQTMRFPENGIMQTWYDQLGVTPDNFIEKCEAKGIQDPKSVKFIETWGQDAFNGVNEPLSFKSFLTQKNLQYTEESLNRYEAEILNGSYKDTQKEIYQNCRIKDLRENSKLCLRIMSKYKIKTAADAHKHLQEMTPVERRQVLHCIDSGIFYNLIERPYLESYNPELFTHIRNGGSGDCLFIAFANYLRIVKLNNGVYPDPLIVQDNIQIDYQNAGDDIKTAMKMREEVVKFIRENKDKTLPNSLQSLKLNIAAHSLERSISVISYAEFKTICENFKSLHIQAARDLRLSGKDVSYKILEIALNMYDMYPDAVEVLTEMILKKYLENISKRSTYGGQIEITCLAVIYNVDICVLQFHNKKLVSNMGQLVENPDGVVYLYHTQTTDARHGGLHFETMFPLPRSHFKVASKRSENKEDITNWISSVSMGVNFKGDFNILDCFKDFLQSESDETKLEVLQILWIGDLHVKNFSVYNFSEKVIMSCNKDTKYDALRILLNNIIGSDKHSAYMDVFIQCLNKDKELTAHRKNIEGMILDTSGSEYEQIKNTLLDYFAINDKGLDREELHGLDILELFYIVNDLEDTPATTGIKSYFIVAFFDLIFINVLSNIDNLKAETELKDVYKVFETLPIIDSALTIDNIINYVELYTRLFTFDDEDQEHEDQDQEQEHEDHQEHEGQEHEDQEHEDQEHEDQEHEDQEHEHEDQEHEDQEHEHDHEDQEHEHDHEDQEYEDQGEDSQDAQNSQDAHSKEKTKPTSPEPAAIYEMVDLDQFVDSDSDGFQVEDDDDFTYQEGN